MSESNDVILIAPWGNPAGWYYTCYERSSSLSEEYKEQCSFTSLKPLASWLNPAKIYVLTPDTLPASPTSSLKHYNELVKAVKDYVSHYLCGVEAQVQVCVLPGVIRRGSIKVDGDPSDYYYLLLYHLVTSLLAHSSKASLDLTHGINYMPSLTYKALKEAAALTSLHESKGFMLEVYNSDPVQPDGEVRKVCRRNGNNLCNPQDPEKCKGFSPKASIHKISKETLGPLHAISELDGLLSEASSLSKNVNPLKSRREPENREAESLKRASKAAEDVWRDAVRILKMIRYGLIPELAYYHNPQRELPQRLLDAIKSIVEEWTNSISVGEGSGNLRVERPLRFTIDFKLLIYAYAVSRAAEESLGNDPQSLKAVWRLSEAFYNGTKLLLLVQRREKEKLHHALQETAKKGDSSICQLRGTLELKDLYSIKKHEGSSSCEVFERDLIAHGGWHTNIVRVKPYCKEGAIDEEKTLIEIQEKSMCRSGDKELNIWDIIDTL